MDDQRRRICQAGGGLILASALLPTASGCLGSANNGNVDGGANMVFAGTTDQLPVGMIIFVQAPGHNINVCRDAGGYYALDGNCTHAHCVLLFGDMANPSGFACPCHMSTFDYGGENPTGPAATTGPLPHFKVMLTGTKIYVDPTSMVDAKTRVM